jgi:hypothetical protein
MVLKPFQIGHGTFSRPKALYQQSLAIDKRLAGQDKSNAGWQQDLATIMKGCWLPGGARRLGRRTFVLGLIRSEKTDSKNFLQATPGIE